MHFPRKACGVPVNKLRVVMHHMWCKSPKSNSKIQHYHVTAVTYLMGPTKAFRGRSFSV